MTASVTAIIGNQRERTRFLRFAVVGGIGSVIDFGVMNLLKNSLGLSLVAAGTISFIAAVVSNFTLNRYWTYPDSRSKPFRAPACDVFRRQRRRTAHPNTAPGNFGTDHGAITRANVEHLAD